MKKETNSAVEKAEKAGEAREDAVLRQNLEREEAVRVKREKQNADKRIERARAKKAAKKEKERRAAEARRAREARKAEAHAARLREKREKEEKKAAAAREKRREKEQKAEAKAEKNRQKGKKKKSSGTGGWLAAVISLGVTVLVLSSVLAMNVLMPGPADKALSAMYEKAYFDTVTQFYGHYFNTSFIRNNHIILDF